VPGALGADDQRGDAAREPGARRTVPGALERSPHPVLETGLATYPDVAVVCGPWERDPEDARTVVNPAILVEVLSPSTKAYDRGEKLEHDMHIASLRAVVLVAHDRRELEVWTRSEETWARALFTDGQTAELGAGGFRLDGRAIYDDAAEPPR